MWDETRCATSYHCGFVEAFADLGWVLQAVVHCHLIVLDLHKSIQLQATHISEALPRDLAVAVAPHGKVLDAGEAAAGLLHELLGAGKRVVALCLIHCGHLGVHHKAQRGRAA